MKAVVFSLGCKVNEYESDSLMAGLSDRGYSVSDKLEPADLYIVNTCAVTAEAEKKSRQTASRIKKLNPTAKIIFTGCASQKCPSAFSKKSDNYLVTGTFDKSKILQMLDCRGEDISNQSLVYEELPKAKTLRTRAFIKVQDGCDNFCSYCIIPYLRGRSRSRKIDNVVSEVRNCTSEEVVLTGINLSDFNDEGKTLTDLIIALKDVDKRIRLGSLETGVIDRAFLEALKGLKNFAPHFHLSLQSGSNAVLKKMNRHYTGEEFILKTDLIKEYFINVGITTDIIAGFPTETEEDFEDTLSLVDRVKFTDIHPFTFSPREGTVAYKMQDLPPEVKKTRLDKLIEKKAELKLLFSNSQKGRIMNFIPEEKKDGYTDGYTENYLRVYVKNCTSDNMCKVKIIEPLFDGALGEIVK